MPSFLEENAGHNFGKKSIILNTTRHSILKTLHYQTCFKISLCFNHSPFETNSLDVYGTQKDIIACIFSLFMTVSLKIPHDHRLAWSLAM